MLSQKWYKWFAWYPVSLENGNWEWLSIIERRRCEDMGGSWAEHRKMSQ